ncbi:MAG: methionine--tRNA ligase [Candidatus Levybacteria bacterium RIFCSPLOWO2_01_FULL_36_13]|nr:MAG: methionine--tRNA ligase [Candidatus Levybacteria bacterium RIFCSPHIGHO2_01_FULL_36_15b]OGH34313.1 MAG: methionine--tRNA ligase [Candidatus Levybacteria bacterium RIFCSPLOWO2_01_FULL_36_13]
MNKYYLTTAIPYVNAKPHVGHALEFVQADVIKRFRKSLGEEVLLLSGADENAIKNVQAAEKEGVEVQKFLDTHSKEFEDLAKALNIEFDVFQRGSSRVHHQASQKLWELCQHDIYKKEYTGLYCVGCELFYEKSELDENGQCFEHPGKPLEEVSETNYFFKLSKYEKQIKDLIDSDKLKIYPQYRKNEVLGFLKEGLKDISISRSNKRAKNWGVPVPDDDNQRMYVWFDALNIYQSGIGFNSNEQEYKKWWPADLHVIGKGIIRFHAIYWPAFLLSAGLALPNALFVHGYFTVNGQKMSKTIGNVIDPIEIINKYGVDSLRYYLLSENSPFSDGDFSVEKLEKVYNSDLANGLGNLVSRVSKLCENAAFKQFASPRAIHLIDIYGDYKKLLEEFRFNEALALIWNKISKLDKFINDEKPWELLKVSSNHKGKDLNSLLAHSVDQIYEIAALLSPFLPETSDKIQKQFSKAEIKSGDALFPRI